MNGKMNETERKLTMPTNPKLNRFEKMMREARNITNNYKMAYKKYYGNEPNLKWNGSQVTIENCLTVSFKTLREMTERLLFPKPSFWKDWQKEDEIVHFNWFIKRIEKTIDPECYAGTDSRSHKRKS